MKAVILKPMAAIVAVADALCEARREFGATYRSSYRALTDDSGIADPSEGRGMVQPAPATVTPTAPEHRASKR